MEREVVWERMKAPAFTELVPGQGGLHVAELTIDHIEALDWVEQFVEASENGGRVLLKFYNSHGLIERVEVLGVTNDSSLNEEHGCVKVLVRMDREQEWRVFPSKEIEMFNC